MQRNLRTSAYLQTSTELFQKGRLPNNRYTGPTKEGERIRRETRFSTTGVHESSITVRKEKF